MLFRQGTFVALVAALILISFSAALPAAASASDEPGPELGVSGDLDFGDLQVGETSDTQQITLTGLTTEPATVTSIEADGNADQFGISDFTPCQTTYDNGYSCTITVSFKPATTGGKHATVTIVSDGLSVPKVVNLQGTGVAPTIEVSPDAVDFGQVNLGAEAGSDITVQAGGIGSLSIGDTTITGPDSDQFSIVDDHCRTAILPSGDSCTTGVRYKPTRTGPVAATLNVPTYGKSDTVALSGEAVDRGITLTPSTQDFGARAIGSIGVSSREITIASTGTTPIEVSDITISGQHADDFTISKGADCYAAGQPGGPTCAITVGFKPLAGKTGIRSATLSVLSDAGPAKLSVLTGTAAAAAPPKVRLKLRATGSPRPGKKLTFRGTVTNTGSTPIGDLLLKVKVPSKLARPVKPVSVPMLAVGKSRPVKIRSWIQNSYDRSRTIRITVTATSGGTVLATYRAKAGKSGSAR